MELEKVADAVTALYGDAEVLNRTAARILRDSMTNEPGRDEAPFSLCDALDEFGAHLRALNELLGLPEYFRRRSIAMLTLRFADSLAGKTPPPCGRDAKGSQ